MYISVFWHRAVSASVEGVHLRICARQQNTGKYAVLWYLPTVIEVIDFTLLFRIIVPRKQWTGVLCRGLAESPYLHAFSTCTYDSARPR